MNKKDLDKISLIYESVGSKLVVYEVTSEDTGRVLYVKEFTLPSEKISGFIAYLKNELKEFDFAEEPEEEGLTIYSAIKDESDEDDGANAFPIHRFYFMDLNKADELKREYFIGIESSSEQYAPSSIIKRKGYLLDFIKNSKFPNERQWP